MALSTARTKLVHRLADRKGRPREGAVLVEGVRAVEEAVGRAPSRFAVTSPALERTERGAALAARLDELGIDRVSVPDRVLGELADTARPQGVLLVVDEPRPELPAGGWLVLDALQDPGNVGTLVRTARALGVAGVVALDGTVDPWNPKSVRASAGAVFHVPVVRHTWVGLRDVLGDRALYAGAAGGTPVHEVEHASEWALALGNEGSGVRAEILEAGARTVAVPMVDGAESLNAAIAGAILLYAFSGSGR